MIYLEGPSPGNDLLIRSVVVTCTSSDQSDSESTGPLCDDNENIIQNPRFDDRVNRLCGRCCKIALHDSDGKVLPMSGKVVASTENCTEIGHEIQQEIMGRVQKKPTCESVGAVRVFGYNISSSDQMALH
ncbi:UNVERIFIED_CONTAM: Endo-1,4-beta-xylanase 1 [Sesamum calycinum]|uniref:Endo-1,4-beta-xylanase 1 n=1 Tax=Sesamum calycinum TaxID=2727403 RepID=A0AAW2MQC3_9LAMI